MKKSKSQESPEEITCWIDKEQVDCKSWDKVECDITVEVTDDDEFVKLHKQYDL